MGGVQSTQTTAAEAMHAEEQSSEDDASFAATGETNDVRIKTKAPPSSTTSPLLQCLDCEALYDTNPSSADAGRHLPITCRYCFDCTRCARCTDQYQGLCPKCKKRGMDSSLPDVHICAVLLSLQETTKKQASNLDAPVSLPAVPKNTKYQVGMKVQARFRGGAITAVRRVKRYCIRYYDGYQEELDRADLMQDTFVLVQGRDGSDSESSSEESRKLSSSTASPEPIPKRKRRRGSRSTHHTTGLEISKEEKDHGGDSPSKQPRKRPGPNLPSPFKHRRVGSVDGTDGSCVWKAKLRLLVPRDCDCPTQNEDATKDLTHLYRLMDDLFETGTAIKDCLRGPARYNYTTQIFLTKNLRKRPDHWAFEWYRPKEGKVAPCTVDDLEKYIEFLLEYYLRKPTNRGTCPFKLVPSLGSQASAPGSRDPFDLLIPNSLCVPRSFRGVLAGMQELWGEEDDINYEWNQSRSAFVLNTEQSKDPSRFELSWHDPGEEFAPHDKTTCRVFMEFARRKIQNDRVYYRGPR